MIKFQNLTEQQREKFLEYCKSHPNVIFFIEGIGVSDVDIDLEMESSKNLHEFILDLKYRFGDILKDYEILLISEELKATYLSPIKYLLS